MGRLRHVGIFAVSFATVLLAAPAALNRPPPLEMADRPVAAKMRDLLAARSARIFASNGERAAVQYFYRIRHLTPLWIARGQKTARADAVIARLASSDAEGLDPDDYAVTEFSGDAARLADAELRLTAAVIRYARDVQGGRLAAARVSAAIDLPQKFPEPASVLAKVADADDAGAVLADFSPPHREYKSLRAALARLRAPAAAETAVDAPELADAALPRREFAADDRQRLTDIDAVVANMERWRWMPRDLGATHVMVNIPAFSLAVVDLGATVWQTKVMVGQRSLPTPVVSRPMTHITVNPTWNVPQSIVTSELLPAIRKDPALLERMGLQSVERRDGTVHLFQPPGDRNALGRLRFNFTNKYQVYLHDTPDKHLFLADARAYSHGCVRVQDAMTLAVLLLTAAHPQGGYTRERLRDMYGSAEIDIDLPAAIQVHLSYQTAMADDAGALSRRPDIYRLDERIIAMLKGRKNQKTAGRAQAH